MDKKDPWEGSRNIIKAVSEQNLHKPLQWDGITMSPIMRQRLQDNLNVETTCYSPAYDRPDTTTDYYTETDTSDVIVDETKLSILDYVQVLEGIIKEELNNDILTDLLATRNDIPIYLQPCVLYAASVSDNLDGVKIFLNKVNQKMKGIDFDWYYRINLHNKKIRDFAFQLRDLNPKYNGKTPPGTKRLKIIAETDSE